MSVEMRGRAKELERLFAPPRYRVELVANEREIMVVDEESHAAVEIGEFDFALDPEGRAEVEYIRDALS